MIRRILLKTLQHPSQPHLRAAGIKTGWPSPRSIRFLKKRYTNPSIIPGDTLAVNKHWFRENTSSCHAACRSLCRHGNRRIPLLSKYACSAKNRRWHGSQCISSCNAHLTLWYPRCRDGTPRSAQNLNFRLGQDKEERRC